MSMHDSDFGCLEVNSAARTQWQTCVFRDAHVFIPTGVPIVHSANSEWNHCPDNTFFFLLSGLFSDSLSAGAGSGPGTHIHHAAAR